MGREVGTGGEEEVSRGEEEKGEAMGGDDGDAVAVVRDDERCRDGRCRGGGEDAGRNGKEEEEDAGGDEGEASSAEGIVAGSEDAGYTDAVS